jgi:Zn-dependent peptidase ImmA (M78 family)
MPSEQAEPRIGFARKQARVLLKRANITKPPILLRDVVAYLQKDNDIQIRAWNLGTKVSGIQAIEDGTSFIAYNVSQHQHRQRFSVAHEIGHFVLGHTAAKNYDYEPGNNNSYETEAFSFAAELLMPLEMVKKDYIESHDPNSMAWKYFVSQEAMWKHLLEHHIIK